MSLIGPMEVRLLALERKQAHIDDDLRGLKHDSIALSQGIWDAWSDVRLPIGGPQGGCSGVADFPDVCPCLPLTLPLHDSYYGDCALTYDRSQLAWSGCQLVSLPANPSCSAVPVFALHYTLNGDGASSNWNLVLQYKTANFSTHCPVPSTCSDAPNQSLNLVLRIQCSGTSSVSFSVNGTIPGTQCYPAFRNVTLSITLP